MARCEMLACGMVSVMKSVSRNIRQLLFILGMLGGYAMLAYMSHEYLVESKLTRGTIICGSLGIAFFLPAAIGAIGVAFLCRTWANRLFPRR
jgi:hypothetical protein